MRETRDKHSNKTQTKVVNHPNSVNHHYSVSNAQTLACSEGDISNPGVTQTSLIMIPDLPGGKTALTWYLGLVRENWHRARWESRNIGTTCSSRETRSHGGSKSNLRSLIDFTPLNTFDSQAETGTMHEGVQIIMSHNVTGGPNDVSAVDLQLNLHVFCNKSPLSVSLSPSPLLRLWKTSSRYCSRKPTGEKYSSRPSKWWSANPSSSHQRRCQFETSNYR